VKESGSLDAFPDALISAIYGGLTEQNPWTVALDLLRNALGSSAACLRISTKGSHPREYIFASGPIVSSESLAFFEGRSARELLPVELLIGEPRAASLTEVTPPGAFSEKVKEADVDATAVMLVEAGDGVEYILQICRNSAAPAYSEEDLAFLKVVGGHFGRALKLRRELVRCQVVNGFQSDTLDRLGIAAILVNWSGHFSPLNQTARQVLAEGEGLRVSGGRLHAVDERDDRSFQAILKEVLGVVEGDLSRAMLIKQSGEGRDLNLLVSARRSVSLISDRAETCALVFLRRSSVADDADVDVLQQLFSFTRAEAKLALGLAKGKRLEEVESELNIRHNTARAHLRSMFVKADVNRQSELVHLLANSLAPLGRPLEKVSAAA